MNDINFTYDIVSVNVPARCMEVVYKSEGHKTMHIGMRLPFEGETPEDVIRCYAPLEYWQEQQTPVVIPVVGYSGSIAVTRAPAVEPAVLAAQDQPVQSGAEEF